MSGVPMDDMPEALRLAEWLDGDGRGLTTLRDCSAELRRLHEIAVAYEVVRRERDEAQKEVYQLRAALAEPAEPVQEPFASPCPTPKACKAHCCSGHCIPRTSHQTT